MNFPMFVALFFSTALFIIIYEACLVKVQPSLVRERFVSHWCNLAAKESGLECACVNNDTFTVLVSGGGRCHWVSMCTVALALKMTEWVEQGICIKFCIKLPYPSTETTQMIQKATAIGNWWLAASSHNVPTHASRLMQSFFEKHQIAQVTQPHYSPDLVPCGFWLFPKL